jgi:cell division GTPase FtsZ
MTEENDNNEVEKPPIGIAPPVAEDVFAEFQEEEDEYDSAEDDFDFVEHYDVEADVAHEEQLPDNTAISALNCAFIGFGGGGGKLAKAFLDLGFNKTLLINTTLKDQPEGVDPKHIILIPDADGVAKNISFGKSVLQSNSAVVEDALRTKLGKVDWIFVLAGGGGGTGSSCPVLHDVFHRYLQSVQGEGDVVYIVTWPSAQESLNSTINKNALSLVNDIIKYPHIILDNERQMQFLRGKVGVLDLLPTANRAFAKLFHQILKLANEQSPIQSFDSKDLERCLRTPKRTFIGSTVITNPRVGNLGAIIFQNCLKKSPCSKPSGKPKTGTMLFVISPEMANDPEVSKHLDAAISYVGGRTETLFSGIYIRKNIPGLIAILSMSGLN